LESFFCNCHLLLELLDHPLFLILHLTYLVIYSLYDLLTLSLLQCHQLIHPSLLLLQLLNLLLIPPPLALQLSVKRMYLVIKVLNVHLELVLHAEVRPHVAFKLLYHLLVLLEDVVSVRSLTGLEGLLRESEILGDGVLGLGVVRD
jgi:hypothetical protein